MGKVIKSGTACYAQGGVVIGKDSEFMKTPDRFRGGQTDPNTFGKGGKGNSGQATGRPNPAPKNKQAKF